MHSSSARFFFSLSRGVERPCWWGATTVRKWPPPHGVSCDRLAKHHRDGGRRSRAEGDDDKTSIRIVGREGGLSPRGTCHASRDPTGRARRGVGAMEKEMETKTTTMESGRSGCKTSSTTGGSDRALHRIPRTIQRRRRRKRAKSQGGERHGLAHAAKALSRCTTRGDGSTCGLCHSCHHEGWWMGAARTWDRKGRPRRRDCPHPLPPPPACDGTSSPC